MVYSTSVIEQVDIDFKETATGPFLSNSSPKLLWTSLLVVGDVFAFIQETMFIPQSKSSVYLPMR